jgi:D-alanyl-D-alanine carboxypeptidase
MTRHVPREEVLQDVLDGLVSRKSIRHAVVGVLRGDESFRWIGAAGDADGHGTPMRVNTPFRIASITKLYAATIALRLHERGQLGLDDPISAHLPTSITEGLHRSNGVDRTSSITVRHLLDHTSGLANYFEDRPAGGLSLSQQLFREGDRSWSIEDVAEMTRGLKPHFAPGMRIRYSDTNYQLLGAIIECVTGKAMHAVLADELLDPLGLEETYLAAHPGSSDPVPPAALFFEGRPLHVPMALESIGADGGLVSTIADLFRFMRAVMTGEVFERPQTLQAMHARWIRFGFPLDAAAMRAPSWPIRYGLGIMRFQLPRVLNGMRPMPVLLGHTGSTGSWLFYAPERDLYLAGTVDEVTSGAVPYRLLPKLLRTLDRDEPPSES